jgi:RING-type zinc-finger
MFHHYIHLTTDEPFPRLPGCNHSFCRECLRSWFKACLLDQLNDQDWFEAYAHHAANITSDILQQFHRDHEFYPVYGCPICRAEVEQRPCEAKFMDDLIDLVSVCFEGFTIVDTRGTREDWDRLFIQ